MDSLLTVLAFINLALQRVEVEVLSEHPSVLFPSRKVYKAARKVVNQTLAEANDPEFPSIGAQPDVSRFLSALGVAAQFRTLDLGMVADLYEMHTAMLNVLNARKRVQIAQTEVETANRKVAAFESLIARTESTQAEQPLSSWQQDVRDGKVARRPDGTLMSRAATEALREFGALA